MAIRLLKGTNDSQIELKCTIVGTDSLTFSSNVLYDFPDDTSSNVQYDEKTFKPNRLHMTPKFHEGDHMFELIIQLDDGENENMYFCFPIIKSASTDAIKFPLTVSPLTRILTNKSEPTHYKTKGNQHVFVWSHSTDVSEYSFPIILGDPEKKYKEIMEPNTFESKSSVITVNDTHKKRTVQGEKVTVVVSSETIQEGFEETELTCQMYVDNKAVKSDYALAPLNSGAYERGLVFFNVAIVVVIVGAMGFFISPLLFNKLIEGERAKNKVWWFWGLVLASYAISIIFITTGCVMTNAKTKVKTGLVYYGFVMMLLTFFSMTSISIQDHEYLNIYGPISETGANVSPT